MAVNRVDFGGDTLIDLTGDTLESAEQLLKGITAHAKDGSVITGNMEAGGGGETSPSAKWNDVTFIDYDGSVLYSYSLAEAQALTALPELPSHDGLVCQGWNWTLEEIKSLNRPVTVGAMYITDDVATRLHIRIATEGRMTVPLHIWQSVPNGVSIDWGDGSAAETISGDGDINPSHTYAEPGNYVISLMPKDGCTLSLSDGSSSSCVIGTTANTDRVYCNMLQEVYVGKHAPSISDYAFYICYSLESVTIPKGVTSIRQYAFRECSGLDSIAIPCGVTSIDNNAFYSCFSLASVTIPDKVTSIRNYAFRACHSLASVTIPKGITSIGTYAFNSCYGMRFYDFSACTSVPTLAGTNAFTSIPSDCQMLIPASLYDEWKAATNWATYAKYMVAV